MKNYLRILQYVLPYRRQIAGSIFFNIAMVFFSLGSITILIPILKIILENTQEVVTPMAYTGISELRPYLENQLNYKITGWIAESGAPAVLFSILLFALVFFFLKNLTRYIGSVYLVYIKNGVERDIRRDIHKKVLHLPLSYFSEKQKGDIVARLTTDIIEVQWAILSSIQRLVQDPLMLISTLILLVVLSPKLTLFVAILIPVTGFVITSIGNTLKKPSERAKAELGKILSKVDEHLGGLTILKSYVAEDRAHISFQDSNQKHFQYMNQMLYRRQLSSPISELLGTLVIIAIIWFGSMLILRDGNLEPEVFITYIVLFYQIINPAKSISTAIYDIKRGDASAARIFEVIDTQNNLEDKPDAQTKTDFTKGISLNNVHFTYPDDTPVLADFNLTIPKGKTIALVGQSGSGKSTIANLLNRFYDVQKGEITIDGLDIRQIKIKDLRQLIGYISQEAILFNDTVRNNLMLGKPQATAEEVMDAAKVANAHEFIMQLQDGYDTNIGDRGSKLSGGQRQRLTIARAVLKNPPILILDEATSALDSESEMLVQQALEKLMANRTSLVIAHRLSTIQHADEIILLRDGQIVEKGTHQELLEKDGDYQKMVYLQAF
ncbi:MAG: ABC transporter ATP-binding protein [Saprospiraceae bacterium]|nr:ABC transporter ATP-binding protein [Saprospiraceae bacterium]